MDGVIILLGIVLLAVIIGAATVLLRRVGELTGRSAPPLPAPTAAAQAAIKLLGVKPGTHVLDLGCGSGRFLATVLAAEPKTRVSGLDHDPSVVLVAHWRLRGSNAKIIRADIFTTSWPPAEAVFCYLYPELLTRLEPLLASRLKPGTRLVTADYPLPGRKADRTVTLPARPARGHTLYLYQY